MSAAPGLSRWASALLRVARRDRVRLDLPRGTCVTQCSLRPRPFSAVAAQLKRDHVVDDAAPGHANKLIQTGFSHPLNGAQASIKLQLRPYQQEAIDACTSGLDRGLTSIGVSSPTGSGKTVIFTHLIPKLLSRGEPGGQVLILVGAIELAHQTIRTIQAAHPHLSCELEQGAIAASGRADVTVAMYQTLRDESRLRKFDPARFKAVIVDEAHHAAAKTYAKLLAYFNSYVQTEDGPQRAEPGATDRPHVPLIGFSATFSRNDKVSLGSVFQEIVYHRDVSTSLEEGWLSPIAVKRILPHYDEDKLVHNAKTGDFSADSMQREVDGEAGRDMVVQTYLELAQERKSTLVFAVDITHAEHLTNDFRRRGIDARTVSSRTTRTVRLALIEGFKRGEFPVLVNCEILTEGTDVPNIDCILLVRPTESSNLLMQMVGRGLRLFPGKTECLVIDFVDNFARLGGLHAVANLYGLEVVADEAEAAASASAASDVAETAPLAQEGQDRAAIDSITVEDVEDPFGLSDQGNTNVRSLSRNAWVTVAPRHLVLDARDVGRFAIVPNGPVLNIEFATEIPKELGAKMKFGPAKVIGCEVSLKEALRAADKVADRKMGSMAELFLRRNAAWRKDPASDRQMEWLRTYRGGRFAKDNMTKGQVGALMVALKCGAANQRARKDRAIAKQAKDDAKKQQKARPRRTVVGPLA